MKRAADGNNPSKNLLAVYGDKSVYGIGGTVAEPGPRMYPSNLIADVSNSAVTTNVWRRDA